MESGKGKVVNYTQHATRIVREYTDDDAQFVRMLSRKYLLCSVPELRLGDLPEDQKLSRMQNWYDQTVKKIEDVPTAKTFIAVDENDNRLGYVMVFWGAKDDFRAQRQGFLCDLAVKEKYWRTGVAQALTEAAEDFVRSKGAEFMALNVSAFNKRAVNFYQKLGYVEEWKVMGKKLKGDA